jgi:colanic acid biosynthesis glycosyl transferase WcaI
MPRIIFLNRYFHPDHSATSQILSDLAFDLAGAGHEVSVVTSRQRYDEPQAQLPETETIRGVAVHRLATTRFGRASILGRGLDYLSYFASMHRAVLALARRGDILVAKTDPPLLCIPALHAARRRGLHLVNWLQDLYPEVAMRLGVPLMRGPAAQGFARLRDAALRAAAANVVVSDSMAQNIHLRGIAPDRVHVIANWCDDTHIRPLPQADNPLRDQWGLAGRFVVGYSGNLGRAHEFETVLAAADLLRADERFAFLFVGGGHRIDELSRRVAAGGLARSFRFAPYQDNARLPLSLGLPDLHWVSLKPELEGLIFPSKLYGIAAAGRPVVAITALDGEIGRLVRRHDCGFVVAPGDAAGLAATLLRAAADRDGLAAKGGRARAMLEAEFARQQALARWRAVLEQVGNQS